jgi:hypothetical protein
MTILYITSIKKLEELEFVPDYSSHMRFLHLCILNVNIRNCNRYNVLTVDLESQFNMAYTSSCSMSNLTCVTPVVH